MMCWNATAWKSTWSMPVAPRVCLGARVTYKECQWLLKLHAYGLLRSCFLPAPEIHGVRTVWRLRDQHVKDAGRCIQHMQKALIEMNVQLHIAISDLSGVTGQAIIRAILSGQRDPRALAALRHCCIQATEEEIIQSLQGNWKPDVLFELQQAVDAYDFYQKQMAACDTQLKSYLAALPTREALPTTAADSEPAAAADGRKKRRPRKPQGNQPAFDLAAELERILGSRRHPHRRHRGDDNTDRAGRSGARSECLEDRRAMVLLAEPSAQARHQRGQSHSS